MTDKTKTLGIRINSEDKDKLSKYITRKSLESILRQIDSGEIEITENGVKILQKSSVNTNGQSVNTTVERVSENQKPQTPINASVNTSQESVNTYEDDPDGEWVREMAHDLNISVDMFKRKIEQSIKR